MGPIEKFTQVETKSRYDDKEIEYTEYIWIIAEQFVPEEIPEEDQYGNKFFFITSKAITTFKRRYNEHLIKIPLSYKEYMSDQAVQDNIQAHGLDVDKLWFAVVFTWDYCEGECIYGTAYSYRDAISELFRFYKLIHENEEKDQNPLSETVSFKNNISLTVNINNKKALTIEHANAIKLLALTYTKYNEDNPDVDEEGFVVFKNPALYEADIKEVGPVKINITYHITLFYRFLNFLFKKTIRKKVRQNNVIHEKLFLISQLVYLTKISNNENFYLDPATIKGYIKRYKNKYSGSIQNRYYH